MKEHIGLVIILIIVFIIVGSLFILPKEWTGRGMLSKCLSAGYTNVAYAGGEVYCQNALTSVSIKVLEKQ